MSDPLSVAGSAVGVVSLGIHVCQSLVSYLRSIQGRRQEIAIHLREAQSLISVFSSLNDVLPRLDQQRCADSPLIRQCLLDCRGQLVDLRLLLSELRSTPNPTDIKGKMKEAGRAVLYPFREGELTSIHRGLQSLLHNLSLAISTASLKSHVSHGEGIEAIRTAVEGLGVDSHLTGDAVRDLTSEVQQNSSLLALLDSTVSQSLDDIKETVSRTEGLVRDFEHNTNGRLSDIHSDVRSITSTTFVTSQAVTELSTKLDALSEQFLGKLSEMSITISQPQEAQSGHHQTDSPLGSTTRPFGPPPISPTSARTGCSVLAPPCHCPLSSSKEPYRYSIWGMEFQLSRQPVPRHRPGCKFHGISRKEKTTLRAQFPLKFGHFLGRFNRACVEYAVGAGHPGISLRFTNIVPESESPVQRMLDHMLGFDAVCSITSPEEFLDSLEMTEKAVISLYRDGTSSPWDLTEDGWSHAALLLESFAYFSAPRLLTGGVVEHMLRFLRAIATLGDATGDDGQLPRVYRVIPSSLDYLSHLLSGSEGCKLLLSYVGSNFEVSPKLVIEFGLGADVLPLFPYFPSAIKLTPIARAILSKSERDLSSAIAQDSGSVTESIHGYTALQLCAAWPEGLQRLLRTEARQLIDVGTVPEGARYLGFPDNLTPVSRALSEDCVETVDLLMKAGCALDFGPELEVDMIRASDDCVAAIASNLAERRRQLLRLCQRELGTHLDWDPIEVPDEKAGALCAALTRSGIPVPRHLSVPPGHATVFHFSGLHLRHWGVFWENGFRDFQCRNPMGLSPIMTWRPYTFRNRTGFSSTPTEQELLGIWRWAQDEKLLDQTQKDPLSLGLNTSATGWHYMAATVGFTFVDDSNAYVGPSRQPRNRYFYTPFPYRMINDLSKTLIGDQCECWCNARGQGCSAVKSLWNAHACWRVPLGSRDEQAKHNMLWRHCLFHHHKETEHLNQIARNPIVAMSLELVRLLTFEILDMTHTCCYLEQLESLRDGQASTPAQRKALSTEDYWDRFDNHHVIANCCSQLAAEIRSDSLEQQNAQQLDALMQDFEPQILSLDFSDPKALEGFIWGPWRRHISDLFAVDSRVVAEMEQVVENVSVTCKFINQL
ncbi:hypothetical protein C8A01DRAFT_20473 [Parachaetomium inaequale]|uniref:Fungal N-terminal domain-containing protein n=1 Tax=Parachaetomium inaequale TaxID=2588326 RepID=A0AAN6P625_9PEZI|nr:hypothetical protein C8A01DRAFT_20473 [Parachaetomium inaequale]